MFASHFVEWYVALGPVFFAYERADCKNDVVQYGP